MKRVVQVRLLPSSERAQALRSTLRACNESASLVAREAFERSVYRNYDLRKIAYASVRDGGLSSQPAQHVIKKVADAYTTLRASLRNGNYGKPGSARRIQVESKPVVFRPDAAQPFDDRCLSWQYDEQTVSIWATQGPLKGLRCTGGPTDLAALVGHRKGESDLIERDGRWFLIATLDEPDVPVTGPDGWLDTDLGIVNIATTSDGTNWSGDAITARRKKNGVLRARLQQEGSKSAKRLLKKRSRKETRFVRDVTHQISKKIVETATRTGQGIALEELTGIRDRGRLRKPQRSTLHSWAFAQLGAFITYKANRVGVAVTYVEPAHTSQMCSTCGHGERANRPNQATFVCRSCGVSPNAGHNAVLNIAARGPFLWGAVNLPNAA